MVAVKTTDVSRPCLAGQGEQSLASDIIQSAVSHKDRRRKLLRVIAEQRCCLDEKAAAVDIVLLVREDRER